jgi:hypothetical protein
MRTDSEILDYWFEKRNLSEATREVYTKVMKHYCFITGKNIIKLHDEKYDE